MAMDGVDKHRPGKWEEGNEPMSKHQIQALVWKMTGLTRDGITVDEPFSQDHFMDSERGQEMMSPVQLTSSRIGNHTCSVARLLNVMAIHTQTLYSSFSYLT